MSRILEFIASGEFQRKFPVSSVLVSIGVVLLGVGAIALGLDPVSYTHLTLPTTPYV